MLVMGAPFAGCMAQNNGRQGNLKMWEQGLLGPDAEVRSSSALSLMDSTVSEAHRILMAALQPGQPAASRASVLKVAAFRRDPRFLEPAQKALAEPDAALQRAGASYCAAIATGEALAGLGAFLNSPKIKPERKVPVIEALEGHSSKQLVHVLIRQLASPNAAVRAASSNVLARISGQSFGDDRDAWTTWWDANKGLSREQWIESVVDVLQKQAETLRAENARLEKELLESHRRLFASLQGEAKTAELANALSSPYAAVRVTAANEIGAAGLRQAAPGLRKLLADPSASVRAGAARALSLLGDTSDAEAIIALLHDAAPEVQAAAAKALGKLKAAAAVQPLCRLARAGDEAVAEASIDAVGEIADAGAVPSLLAELASPSPRVREAASRALGLTARAAPPDVQQAAVCGLVTTLADANERVRWYAVHSLAQIKSQAAEPALIRMLGDKSPRVREEAASALGSIGSPRARPGLAALLGDEDGRAAHQAANALMNLGKRHPDQAGDLAELFYRGGDFRRAATLWLGLLERATEGEQRRALRARLARAYAAQQDWPPVVLHLTAAIKIRNSDPKLWAQLAQAHLKLKAHGEAAKAYAEYMKATQSPSAPDWQLAVQIARSLADQKHAPAAAAFISELRSAHATLGGEAKPELEAIERQLGGPAAPDAKPKEQEAKPQPKPAQVQRGKQGQ